MNKKATIYDIAQKLNISAATVSRALNGKSRISDATKKLVLETAEQLNYEPNRVAKALREGRGNHVGVILPYINRTFFSSVIRGIEEELYPKGYHIIISQTHEKEERESEIVQSLLDAQVEGIIMSVSRSTKSDEHLRKVTEKGIPLVFFDRKYNIPNISSVVIDDFQAGYLATTHLIDQNCKRIAHLTVDLSLEIYQNRLKGYQRALEEHQIPFDEQLVFTLKSDIEEGKQAAQKLMSLPEPPDGIFSASDYGALGVIRWLKDNDYKIPEDVCVVGFSNEPFTQFMDMPISSIDQSPLEMGKMAAQVFLETVESENIKIEKKVMLNPTLHIRESSTRN